MKKKGDDNRLLTLDEIAQQLGTSKTTLKELLEIERKLTPEIKELLDTGIISKTAASKIWTKLSEQEQLELLEELGKDKLKEMSQQQLQKYINENKQLEQKTNNLILEDYLAANGVKVRYIANLLQIHETLLSHYRHGRRRLKKMTIIN